MPLVAQLFYAAEVWPLSLQRLDVVSILELERTTVQALLLSMHLSTGGHRGSTRRR
jgi:hypothetical protein